MPGEKVNLWLLRSPGVLEKLVWRSQPWAIRVRSKGGKSGPRRRPGCLSEGCLCSLAGPVRSLPLKLGGASPVLELQQKEN